MLDAKKFDQPQHQARQKKGFAGREAFAEALRYPEVEGFMIQERLGQGGMAEVYSAIDAKGRNVALKLFRKSDGSHLENWFYRECTALFLLSHPNIASAFAFGETADHLYLSMEKIKGKSLFHALSSKNGMGWEMSRRILIGLSSALEETHRAGIVHRDVKPENVIAVRGALGAKLIDFGLCHIDDYDDIYTYVRDVPSVAPRMTPPCGNFATPEFRPPEFDTPGSSYDPKFDIYPAGLVFYNVVAGDLPFPMRKFDNVADRSAFYSHIHKNAVLQAPGDLDYLVELPEPAERAIMACLDKNPAGRPSGAELRAIFESC